MQFKNLSFKNQIYFTMVSLVSVVLIAGFSYNIFSAYSYKKSSFIQESELQVGLIADNAVAPILFFDQDGLNASLSQLSRYKNILSAHIYLNDGTLYGFYDKSFKREDLNETFTERSWFKHGSQFTQDSLESTSFVIREQIVLNNESFGYLYLEKETVVLSDFVKDSIDNAIIFSMIVLLIIIVVIYYIADTLIKPIVNLSRKLEHISKIQVYKTRLKYKSKNEVGKLYTSFNTLLESIQTHQNELQTLTQELEHRVDERTQELTESLSTLKKAQTQLVESEKMASLGSLVSGVAHEVNTPLGNAVTGSTIIKQESHNLLESMRDGSMKKSMLEESLEHINETARLLYKSVNTAASLIRSFKKISVDQSIEEKRDFDVVEYAQEVVKTFSSQLKKIPVNVKINGPKSLYINSFPGAFAQLLNNFIQNAIVHAFEVKKENAQIIITLEVKGNNLEFIFKDNGAGMNEEIKKKAFDPFVTTKRNAGGTGLGLHIAYNLVTQKLKGTLLLESEEGEGTSFIVHVPV